MEKEKQEKKLIDDLTIKMTANMLSQFNNEDVNDDEDEDNPVPFPININKYIKDRRDITNLVESFTLASCTVISRLIQGDHNYIEITGLMNQIIVKHLIRETKIEITNKTDK